MTLPFRRALLALTVAIAGFAAPSPRAAAAESLHDFTVPSIDGAPMDLAQYRGKAVLLVNTASFCGFTNQYGDLQALHERYADAGFVVLGVPSASFDQEYGDDGKVKEFCEVNYGITFPMTTRLDVTDDDAHPLYQWLADAMGKRKAPKWNFHKYLIDPKGEPVAAFASSVKPDAAKLTAAIERVLPAAETLASDRKGD